MQKGLSCASSHRLWNALCNVHDRLIRFSRRVIAKALLTVTILYAEDNPVVLDAVRETLEAEGWLVDACTDGAAALARIERGGDAYDAMLFDHDLPGICGVELIICARSLPHLRQTPIVMPSASDSRAEEALRSGADVFLRKPDDIFRLVETLSQLIVAAGAHTGAAHRAR